MPVINDSAPSYIHAGRSGRRATSSPRSSRRSTSGGASHGPLAPFRRTAFYFIGDNPYEMFVIRRRAKWLCGPMARRRPEGDGPGHPAYDANAAFEGYA
jgi:hypothetical protein